MVGLSRRRFFLLFMSHCERKQRKSSNNIKATLQNPPKLNCIIKDKCCVIDEQWRRFGRMLTDKQRMMLTNGSFREDVSAKWSSWFSQALKM